MSELIEILGTIELAIARCGFVLTAIMACLIVLVVIEVYKVSK